MNSGRRDFERLTWFDIHALVWEINRESASENVEELTRSRVNVGNLATTRWNAFFDDGRSVRESAASHRRRLPKCSARRYDGFAHAFGSGCPPNVPGFSCETGAQRRSRQLQPGVGRRIGLPLLDTFPSRLVLQASDYTAPECRDHVRGRRQEPSTPGQEEPDRPDARFVRSFWRSRRRNQSGRQFRRTAMHARTEPRQDLQNA